MGRTDALVAFGLLVSAVAVAWVLATPSTAVPVGVSVSTGDSMGYDGARLLLYADVEPERGDVVVFRSFSRWVAHRVVDSFEYETNIGDVEGWQTKGDALEVPDQRKEGGFWSANGEALATERNTAGVVVAWFGLDWLAKVGASIMAAIASMRGFEAAPPKIFARPQGGR